MRAVPTRRWARFALPTLRLDRLRARPPSGRRRRARPPFKCRARPSIRLPGFFRRFAMSLRRLALVSLLLVFGPLSAAAQDGRVVPSSPGQLTMSYAPIVKRVAPAVVNVYAAKLVENRNPPLDDPIFRRFFGKPGGPIAVMQRE